MRLSIRPGVTHVGNVQLHEMSFVSELDAEGQDTLGDYTENIPTDQKNVVISRNSIEDIERNLAIVIPCMNEDENVLQALLRGVPHWCLIIFISNSNQQSFEAECKLLLDFGRMASRCVIVEHQGSPSFARAFQETGMTNLLQTPREGGNPRINNGKGEAMLLGVIIAKHMRRKFVGFIDADNRVPGSVLEYCKVYAAGLHYALRQTDYTGEEQHAMVRIKWKSKPKVRDGELVFDEFGRSSHVVNHWMNRLLKTLGGGTTADTMIGTSNAGEHAMSIDLAFKLRFATGYAVEPFQLIDVWEQFGGSKEPSSPVRILQIETCNPHIHNARHDADHIERMQTQGLSTIYHSNLTNSGLKDELCGYMKTNLAKFMGDDGEPKKTLVYDPLSLLNWNVFEKAFLESETLVGNKPEEFVATQM